MNEHGWKFKQAKCIRELYADGKLTLSEYEEWINEIKRPKTIIELIMEWIR